MDLWQILLTGYLVVGLGIAVTVFRLRHAYAPQRTEFAPSIVASFFSGMFWGIAIPLIVIRLSLQRKKAG